MTEDPAPSGGVRGSAGTLLVVDGNSLLHRAFHAAAPAEAAGPDDGHGPDGPPPHFEGRPIWALRGMLGLLARAAARVRPEALLVGFDCRDTSVRRARFPGYKAHRPDKAADLEAQLDAAPALLEAAGVAVVVPAGLEADDVLASAAAAARAAGLGCVLLTSDRDAYALLDASTAVLHPGGSDSERFSVLTEASLQQLYGIPPRAYPDLAALRGDASDNLPGVPGLGTKTAARLLSTFGSVERAYAALDGGFRHLVEEAVGARAADRLADRTAREHVARNRDLMAMRDDLPLPDLRRMRLPLDLYRLRRALDASGINLGPSLWALTGGDPPVPGRDGFGTPAPVFAPPRRRGPFSRIPGPGQLTIFDTPALRPGPASG